MKGLTLSFWGNVPDLNTSDSFDFCFCGSLPLRILVHFKFFPSLRVLAASYLVQILFLTYVPFIYTQHEDKKKGKDSKRFEKHSKLDQKRTSMKEVFGTIVKKKDDEILMQIEEIEELKRQVEVNTFAVSMSFQNLCMYICTQPDLV